MHAHSRIAGTKDKSAELCIATAECHFGPPRCAFGAAAERGDSGEYQVRNDPQRGAGRYFDPFLFFGLAESDAHTAIQSCTRGTQAAATSLYAATGILAIRYG